MNRIALYHLETLLWIARLGTFRAAAERLNTTQPAISARIRELEAQLGTKIFRRDGRRMVLTVPGRQLVKDCEPLWAGMERILMGNRRQVAVSGIVRIGSGEIAAASCLPGFVHAIEKELPGVTLEISLDLTARLLQQLLNSESDLVFLAGPVASPGISTCSIGSVRLLWLASPSTAHGLHCDMANPPPIWSLPRHSPLYQAMREGIADDRIAHGTINTCNNVNTLIEIVAGGHGIGVFPETMVRDEMGRGALVEILDQTQKPILFQAAIRSQESDPIVLNLFRRAENLLIA